MTARTGISSGMDTQPRTMVCLKRRRMKIGSSLQPWSYKFSNQCKDLARSIENHNTYHILTMFTSPVCRPAMSIQTVWYNQTFAADITTWVDISGCDESNFDCSACMNHCFHLFVNVSGIESTMLSVENKHVCEQAWLVRQTPCKCVHESWNLVMNMVNYSYAQVFEGVDCNQHQSSTNSPVFQAGVPDSQSKWITQFNLSMLADLQFI